MNQCTTQNKERECRVNGSNANNKMCFEVRAPSSTSPPSPRRISNPLTCPPRTPTEGTSTEEDLYNTGSTELLSQPIQPPTRQTNTTSYKRGRPLAKQPQSTSPRGIQNQSPTPPHQEGVHHNLNLYQRGSNTSKGFYNKWYISTTN